MRESAQPLCPPPHLVSVATVRAVTPRGVTVRSERGDVAARVAALGYAPREGDRVLVCFDGGGAAYVVGVLGALREAPTYVIEQEGATTRLVAAGDLELRGAALRLHGEEGVQITSDAEVSLSSGGRSGLRLDGDAAELRAGLLATRAAHLHVLADEVSVIASRLDARIERARRVAKVLETEAEEIVERAVSVFREVEGLAQTKAGRVRIVAESTLHALAGRVKLKARGLFALDGESIHLG